MNISRDLSTCIQVSILSGLHTSINVSLRQSLYYHVVRGIWIASKGWNWKWNQTIVSDQIGSGNTTESICDALPRCVGSSDIQGKIVRRFVPLFWCWMLTIHPKGDIGSDSLEAVTNVCGANYSSGVCSMALEIVRGQWVLVNRIQVNCSTFTHSTIATGIGNRTMIQLGLLVIVIDIAPTKSNPFTLTEAATKCRVGAINSGINQSHLYSCTKYTLVM